jgi:ElaB/YqjD/DUF883 family membrane-anchored ribosome-binding protein
MQKNGTAADAGRIDALKDSVRNLVDASGERASALKDSVVDGSRAGFDRATTFVKDNPFVAIGAAFVVGYFVIRHFRK